MRQYHQEAISTIGNWEPLINISKKLLAEEKVDYDKCSPVLLPIVELMRVVMKVTKESEWDWSNPDIQNVFNNLAESHFYKMFSDATVRIVSSIIKTVQIGTLLEVGTGPGQVTENLCKEMTQQGTSVPLIISDKSPTIADIGNKLRESFPHLTINNFVWDFKKDPPDELIASLTKPVLLFERFCIPYGGYASIDKIGPLADILIMVEDLNLTGEKEAYDVIMEKIGSQFFVYDEAKKHLEKHFSFIHTCDSKTIEAINLPVTDFTLAIK
jgi:hypothetical protein